MTLTLHQGLKFRQMDCRSTYTYFCAKATEMKIDIKFNFKVISIFFPFNDSNSNIVSLIFSNYPN